MIEERVGAGADRRNNINNINETKKSNETKYNKMNAGEINETMGMKFRNFIVDNKS
jgi:hypothetical protein